MAAVIHGRAPHWRLRGIGAVLGLATALPAMAGCARKNAATPAPVIRTMEGAIQAWSPSQEASAEKALGFSVLPPVTVVRRVTGLPLTQVDVEVANPKTIYYIFGKYLPGDDPINATRHDRWVIVMENNFWDWHSTSPYQPGIVKGNGIEAQVQANNLYITVQCDRKTDNALRIAQLISEQ